MLRGSIPADVVFVGEAPGDSEDSLGQPFVGPAGQLLDQAVISAFGSSPTGYALGEPYPLRLAWINLVGCLPRGTPASPRETREPNREEINACSPRLDRLFSLLRPKIIFATGKLSEKQAKLGQWDVFARIIPIVHPAAILRMDVSQQGLAYQRVTVQLADAFASLLQPQ